MFYIVFEISISNNDTLNTLAVDGYKLIDFGCARLKPWSRWIL